MALITFSSPMHKDKTVYAVAGSHTQTIRLAKENHIPIDFGCQQWRMRHLSGQGVVGRHQALADGRPADNREAVAALTELGHITQPELDQMYVDDIPPTQWRLACRWSCATRTSWSNTPASDVA